MPSTTHARLQERYSVLLTLSQLAEILDRSPNGLRISLSTPSSKWAQQINKNKVQIGRRIYFRTEGIAQIIDGQIPASDEADQK
jgi:hypothetical protein